jgi:putative ABC transport system permease protein
MLLSVFSRIREIAILRVCGFSRAQVAGLIFGEAAAVALAMGAVATAAAKEGSRAVVAMAEAEPTMFAEFAAR